MKNNIPYGWLTFAIFPYESIWSLVQKFALWNHCTADEIWRQFKTKQKARPINNNLLLNCNCLDLSVFSKTLQVPHQQIQQSGIDYYLLPGEGYYLTAQTLRYCLDCLSKGYHSPIHQLLFIEYCPCHQKKLQEGCPVCGLPISIRFDNESVKYPFQCTSCKKRFVNPRIFLKPADRTERTVAFKRVSDWLLVRKTNTDESEYLSIWLNKKFSKALKRKRIRFLPVIWSEIARQKPPFQVASGIGRQLKKVEIESNLQTSSYSYDNDKDNYISLCHKIHRNILKNHDLCFRLVSVWTNQFDYTMSSPGYRVCVLANAFIIWRMYWETVKTPSGLVPINDIRRYRSFYYSHYPDNFVDVLSSKSLEATFKEAILLCKLWHKNNLLCLDFRYLNMRLNPYWVLSRRVSESEPQKLLIWREQFPSLTRLSHFTLEHYKDTEEQLLSTFVRNK